MSLDFMAQQCPCCRGDGQTDDGDCCWQCGGSGKIAIRVKRDGIFRELFSRRFFSRIEGVIWLIVVLLVAGLVAYLILKK